NRATQTIATLISALPPMSSIWVLHALWASAERTAHIIFSMSLVGSRGKVKGSSSAARSAASLAGVVSTVVICSTAQQLGVLLGFSTAAPISVINRCKNQACTPLTFGTDKSIGNVRSTTVLGRLRSPTALSIPDWLRSLR